MSDHPILFSGPMIRSLLAGRKTMTRRLTVDGKGRPSHWLKCKPGDLLWVREAWCADFFYDHVPPIEIPDYSEISYLADNKLVVRITGKKRSSMFLTRWASRITLEVTGVKTEPLHNIMWNGDAEREGIYYADRDPMHAPWTWDNDAWCYETPGDAFEALWISINGEEAWTANPKVIAISFRVHRQNIDTLRLARAAA